ncbi:uncharacterized protein LOC107046266, partial [Diachasma alloeum]|uniref:uncharacterized protein LOC107046266 n=1 Tax=Diachasma alloeum TaxID=454923 RepID=UPI0007382D7A
MAEHPGGISAKRRSRRDNSDNADLHHGTLSSSKERRTKRSSKPMKERWLLTRKTWRYMADAGRRLIPDGTHNRLEDIPKIEQYFQEVCQKEPKFLLWRKASYPGSLGFRTHRHRRLHKGGSCRTKASSADEADDLRSSGQLFTFQSMLGGRFDVVKTKRDWLLSSGSTPTTPVARRRAPQEDAEAKILADMLQKYLNLQGEFSGAAECSESKNSKPEVPPISAGLPFDYQSLINRLQQHLNMIMSEGKCDQSPEKSQGPSNSSDTQPPSVLSYRGDYVHKSLIDTLNRHYAKSHNREHIISGILTDRKLLEKLYFDLRCTRGFRGSRATGPYTSPPRWWGNPRSSVDQKDSDDYWTHRKRDFTSPPLIAVQGPSTDRGSVDACIQTDTVTKEMLEGLKEIYAEREREVSLSPRDSGKSSRRRSSVENDDVSPSVSDTIKRYLRMARKKSSDVDKIDRFKGVNYDRNLSNSKAKGEITKPGDDEDHSKGSQTEITWIDRYKDHASLSPEIGKNFSDADTTTSPISRNASSRSSMDAGLGSEGPSTPKHHQSFLSHLLHGSNTHKDKPHSAPGSPALTSPTSTGGAAMQKSKSSSSVVHHGSRLVAKKIWRSRSKSISRSVNQPSTWTPQ